MTTTHTCEYCKKVYDRYMNYVLHMQSAHDVTLPRKRDADVITPDQSNKVQRLEGGKKKRRISDVAKQIVIDDEGILEDISSIKKEIADRIMEEKEDPKYKQGIKYQIAYYITFRKLIGEVITDPPIVFKTTMERLMRNSTRDELEDQLNTKFHDDIEKNMDEFTENGSGWVFLKISEVRISMFDYDALPGGSSYIETPKNIANKNAVINVQNRDNKCFLWSILAALHTPKKDAQRVAKYKPYENELDDNELDYPVKPNSHQISKFEEKNNLSVNIYSHTDKYEIIPLRITSTHKEGRHIDLLLLRNDDGDTHYTWIKNMSRLLKGRTGYKSQRTSAHICSRCLTKCTSKERYEVHKDICNSLNITQRVKYPSGNDNEIKKIHFDKHKKMWLLPFVVYADFESCLQVIEDDSPGKLKKYREHKPISYAFSVASVDPQWNREIKCYTGSDCMEQFMIEIDKLLREIKDVYSKAMPIKKLTDEQRRQHSDATHCFLCKKQFSDTDESAKKQADHCHITGEYRVPACHYCNLENLSLKGIPIPVIFHNLKGYDMHHIMRNIHDRRVEIIANSKEQITMAKIYAKDEEDDGGEEIDGDDNEENDKESQNKKKRKSNSYLTYIDSLSFLKSSLAKLAESIPDDGFKAINEFVRNVFIKEAYPDHQIYPRPPDTEEEMRAQITSLAYERNRAYSWVNGRYNLRYRDMDDYRNWIPAEVPTHLPDDVKQQISEGVALLRKKGIYPYDWMNDEEKMNETQLPPMDEFYNTLNDTHISTDDYAHAQHVWNHFKCQTFQDYHELYLKTDVLLLQDIFENFRDTCMKNYQLDPARYISAPALAWDAMLLFTKVQLDILPEWKSDIYMLYEKGIRGGITMTSKRYAEKEENTSLHYVDANNLYGWAMSQPLPTGDHYSLSDAEIQELNINELLARPMNEDEYGYTFVVDLEYPIYLHDAHNDLPYYQRRGKPKRL